METHASYTRILLSFYLLISMISYSQVGPYTPCNTSPDPVPIYTIDLTASPQASDTTQIILPPGGLGECCGLPANQNCLVLEILLNPNAIGVAFNLSGASGNALITADACGGITYSIDDTICLDPTQQQPFYYQFCRTGTSDYELVVNSISEPIIGPDITLNSGCQGMLYAQYYNESTITWTSVYPGAQGTYDGLLTCTSGCDTTMINAPLNPPAFIDYQVCGEDVSGCSLIPFCDTIRVYFIQPVTVDISPDNSHVCQGDSVLLSTTVVGGTPPYNYLWSNGETTADIYGSNGVYSVQVTDASGCLIAIDNATVIEDIINLTLNGVSPDCFGNSTGAISSAVNGGTPLYSYQWDNGPTGSNQYNLSSGTYTLTVTDANGCQVTDSITLIDPPQLTGSITPDSIICPGSNINITTVINGGTGSYHYLWSPNGEITSSISVNPMQLSNYTVDVTDDNGCAIQLGTTVDVILLDPNDLQSQISSNLSCAGDTVWISGNYIGSDPTVTLSWIHCPACYTSQPLAETPGNYTEYVLSATNSCGQVIYDTVAVDVNPLPVVQIALSSDTVCPDESIIFTSLGSNNPSWSYLWNFGDGFGSNQMNSVHTYNQSGVYPISLTVTDNNGCSSSLNAGAQVVVHQQAVANFDASHFQGSMIEPEIDFYNLSINATDFVWDFGDGTNSTLVSPTHEYQEAGTYSVTLYASNMHGCNDSITLGIFLNPAFEIYVPNAFTPDNDDFNETFFPKGFGISDKGYTFRIFNRWGYLVYETHELFGAWNGRMNNGDLAQDGTYTWTVTFRDELGGRHQKKGHVSLLK